MFELKILIIESVWSHVFTGTNETKPLLVCVVFSLPQKFSLSELTR